MIQIRQIKGQYTFQQISATLIFFIIISRCSFQVNCELLQEGEIIQGKKTDVIFDRNPNVLIDNVNQNWRRSLSTNDYSNNGYIDYDNKNIELKVGYTYKFGFDVQNATFLIQDYSQNKYTYIEVEFDNSQDFLIFNDLDTPKLLANIDKAPYYYKNNKNENLIKAQFFDSNGYYQNKNRFYLLIIQEQESSNNLFITLLLDQQFRPSQLKYQFTFRIISQSSSKPCPFGCFNQGQCIQGKCMCLQYQIDEDCSQRAQKVDISQSQLNQMILKPNVISYAYIKIDNLMTLQKLKVTLQVSSQEGSTCILFQNVFQVGNTSQQAVLPTKINFNNTLCLGTTRIQQIQEYVLTDQPINLTAGQIISIGLILKNQSDDQEVFYKFELFQDQSDSSVDSDDVITIISIVCSFLVTFTLVFICFQYCKKRTSNDISQSFEQPIIEISHLEQSESQKKVDKKKIDKKTLEKYLPSQHWESAKNMLREQKRELTEPFICLVCHLNIESTEKVRVSICYHVLHIECFDEWFINKEFCPMCRREHKLEDLKNNKRGISNDKFEEKMIDMAKVFIQNSQQVDSNETQYEYKKRNTFFHDNNTFSNIIVYKPSRNRNLSINPQRKQSIEGLTQTQITSPYLLSQNNQTQQTLPNQKSFLASPTIQQKKEQNRSITQITEFNKNANKNNLNTQYDIEEVEAEDDENFNNNPNNDKRSSFTGDQLTLNFMQSDLQSTNGNITGQDNQYQRNKKMSFQSSMTDFSNFSPFNMKRFKESQNQVFELEGNLELCDQKHDSQIVLQNNLKFIKRLSQSPQKSYDNQISITTENNFGQSMILAQLNSNSYQNNKIILQNLLPQDQL